MDEHVVKLSDDEVAALLVACEMAVQAFIRTGWDVVESGPPLRRAINKLNATQDIEPV